VFSHTGPGVIVALAALLLVVLLTLVVGWIAPHSTTLPTGMPLQPPSAAHWFGTDQVGRDVFSRVLLGMRSSWWGAVGVIAVAATFGGLIGLIAGTLGGIVDAILMRLTDIFLALPGAVIAIAIVAAIGPSFFHVLLAISVVWWTLYARVMRGEIRRLRASPHTDAARLAGVRTIRLGLRHLLPGAAPPMIITATLDLGALILTLAGLSFLGLGAPDPATELGAMSQRGLPYLLTSWWIPIMPAIGLSVLVLAANFGGDALRALIRDR
jgi:peptide/nickel transport system ATP-binding protein